jgi:hypothetical protein
MDITSKLKIKNYNYTYKEEVPIAKRRNNYTLDESQLSFVKSKLEKEFTFWQNTKLKFNNELINK